MGPVGELIKRRRKEIGMTQKEFAVSINVSQSYVSQIERGVADISFKQIQDIEQVLGLKLTYFPPVLSEHDRYFGHETLRQIELMWNNSNDEEIIKMTLDAEHNLFFRDRVNYVRLIVWRLKALERLQRYDEALNIGVSLAESSSTLPDRELLAELLMLVGVNFDRLREHQKAIENFQQASELLQNPAHPILNKKLLIELFWHLTCCYQYLQDYDSVRTYSMSLRRHTQEQMDFYLLKMSESYYTEALTLYYSGDYENAIARWEDSHRYYVQAGNIRGVLATLNNHAYALKLLGRAQESEGMYQKIIELARKNPDLLTEEFKREMLNEGYDLDKLIQS